MIRECAQSLPDKNFIVRPHPSENHDAWRKFMEKLPNVKIIHSGAAIPWIMGSEGLIHNGCTTAVEAFVLDKPVLSYRPFTDARYDNYLPNALGHEAFNISEAKKWIEMRFTQKESGNQLTEERQAIKDKYMSALSGLTACERILSELNSIKVSGITLKNKYFRSVHKYKTIFESLNHKLSIKKRKKTISKDSLQRNPGIKLIETQKISSKLSQIDNRFSRIQVFSRHDGLIEFIKPN
jgi:hypothetical protein